MPTEWYLMNNKHMSGFEREEIQRQYGAFDELLQQSPESYPITVNSVDTDAIIQSTSDDNKRVVLSRENEVNLGDYIDHKSLKWLVTELPINNRIYDKTKMTLCNETLTIVEETTPVIDYDEFGNEIKGEKQIVNHPFPCVVDDISSLGYEDNGKVNLPEGEMLLFISNNQDTSVVQVDTIFNMYESEYKIKSIDRSKVINGQGFLILHTEKTT